MEPLSHLERIGSAAAEGQDRNADQVANLETARLRFLDASSVKRQPRRTVLLAAAAIVAMLGAVAVTNRGARGPAPLTFTVGTMTGEADAWLASREDAPLPLGFSDGTSVTLEPNARARVTKVTQAGATILVENGQARLSVVKRKGAAWQVSLGPFRVDVTGTRFEVGWDPRSESLTLDMHEGSVLVSGCVFGAGRPFTGGESVRASCREHRVEISTAASPRSTNSVVPAPIAEAPVPKALPTEISDEPAPAASHHPGESAGTTTPRPAPTAASWRDLLRAGRHGEALDAADAAGFSGECASAAAADLVALGDAARYVGRLDRATEAYLAVRRRFPGDERSAVAAFALGRIAFDQRHAYAGAAQWFRTYLSEQPGGRLARDALGRLVESLQREGDVPSARREAAHYLERYPTGPHAEFARRLVNE